MANHWKLNSRLLRQWWNQVYRGTWTVYSHFCNVNVWQKCLYIIFILTVLLLILGILLVSYAKFLYFLLGVLLTIGLYTKKNKYFYLTLIATLLALLFALLYSCDYGYYPEEFAILPIEMYEVSIYQKKSDFKSFYIVEKLKLDEQFLSLLREKTYYDHKYESLFRQLTPSELSRLDSLLALPPILLPVVKREVNSVKHGIITRKVLIAPLNINFVSGIAELKYKGIEGRGLLCPVDCPSSNVELVNFPRSSFYKAIGASDLNPELLSWSVVKINRGIEFIYIIPPFHHLRNLLKPILGVGSINSGVIIGLGSTITLMMISRIKTVINLQASELIMGNKSEDKSRSFTVGGVGGDFKPIGSPIMSDNVTISGTVAESINQLPSSPDPNQPGIKELLTQLQDAIATSTDLEDEDKAEALEQVGALAEAGKNPSDSVMKKAAKTAMKILKGTAASLPTATKLVEEFNELLSVIAKFFGLG